MARLTDDKLSGLQKAAILLITLGPERSAGIFKHLKEEEIEELTLEIANTRSVTPQAKEEVINEFYEVCLAQQYIAEGGISYAKELLEHALGNEKAMEVIGKLTASLQVKPFEFVRKTDAAQLLNFIQDEHPQTIALILSYLSPSQAALIVSALPPDRQADVAKRIAVMDRTSPDVIKDVEKILESKLSSLVNQDYTIIGGVDAVVEILNTVDRGTENTLWKLWRSRSRSWQTRSARKCLCSRIFCFWTTGRSSVCCVMWITMIWRLHSRAQTSRYRMRYSTTSPSVLLP